MKNWKSSVQNSMNQNNFCSTTKSNKESRKRKPSLILDYFIGYSLIHGTCNSFQMSKPKPVRWPIGRSTNFHLQEKLWWCQSEVHREVYNHWPNNDRQNMKILRAINLWLLIGSNFLLTNRWRFWAHKAFKVLKKQFLLKCLKTFCVTMLLFFWNFPKTKSTINYQIQNDSTGQSFQTIWTGSNDL